MECSAGFGSGEVCHFHLAASLYHLYDDGTVAEIRRAGKAKTGHEYRAEHGNAQCCLVLLHLRVSGRSRLPLVEVGIDLGLLPVLSLETEEVVNFIDRVS